MKLKPTFDGALKTTLATLGSCTLAWICLDYLAHKAKAADVILETKTTVIYVKTLVRIQEKQCRLLRAIAGKLDIDSSLYDCEADYEAIK